jgi:hypothetical protein
LKLRRLDLAPDRHYLCYIVADLEKAHVHP